MGKGPEGGSHRLRGSRTKSGWSWVVNANEGTPGPLVDGAPRTNRDSGSVDRLYVFTNNLLTYSF